MKLDNDARLRHDFSQYRAMLKELRRSEESFEDGSKIAYLRQVGIHADSVICKMFRYERERNNYRSHNKIGNKSNNGAPQGAQAKTGVTRELRNSRSRT